MMIFYLVYYNKLLIKVGKTIVKYTKRVFIFRLERLKYNEKINVNVLLLFACMIIAKRFSLYEK